MKFILILFWLFSLCAYNQKDFTGTYYDIRDNGYNVSITSNRFYYIEPNAGWCNDTLAECTWKRKNEQFIEIRSSPDYFNLPFENMNVAVSIDSCISPDSIKMVFSIPYTKSNLNIRISGVYDERGLYKRNIYSGSRCEFMLPKPNGRISYIGIEAIKDMREHDSDGKFYGFFDFPVYFSYNESWIGANYYEINIPLDNSYFEKYYIRKEFVRVHNDTLTWKGRTFVKLK